MRSGSATYLASYEQRVQKEPSDPSRLRDTPRMMSEESTTHELIELTQRLYETADGGDFDAMMRFFGPDAVWDQSEAGIGMFESRG